MTKDELAKVVLARLKLDLWDVDKVADAVLAVTEILAPYSDKFRFDGRAVLWLERKVRAKLA